MARKKAIAVIGSASCSQKQAALAAEVGRLVAEKGLVLICGGKSGVMEAACRGALRAGGLTVGILPGSDLSGGNPYLTLALPTGLGNARNALVALAGNAVIAIGGGPGTLSEIGLALKSGRRVIGLETWKPITPGGELVDIEIAATAEEAVSLALSA